MKSLPFAIALLLFTCASAAHGQAGALPDAPQPEERPVVTVHDAPRDVLRDQAVIWTSPFRLRDSNLAGPIVFGLATTVLITTDHQVMSSVVTADKTWNNRANQASQGLLSGFFAAPVVFYGLGRLHHDEHARETGILATEAILDSSVVGEVAKLVARRERPYVDNARGEWFRSGVNLNGSFPSEHALVAWSAATVIANEYPGWMTQFTAYGLASATSLARVGARQHFPTDVFVGSVAGWAIGRYVVHRHRHAHLESAR